MTVWDWLTSNEGRDLVDAVVLLLTALAAYFSYRAKSQAEENKKALDGHVTAHDNDLPPSGPAF